MTARQPWLDVIRRVPLFAECTEEELRRIDSLFSEAEVPAGQVIVREGAVGRQFVVIVKGEASVTRGGEEINRLGPGDFVGEMALLHSAPRGATVTAVTPMSVYVTNTGEFSSLLAEAPAIERKIRRADAERGRPQAAGPQA